MTPYHKNQILPRNWQQQLVRATPVHAPTRHQLGHKFVYSHVNHEANAQSLKQALELVVKARICHQIFVTAANGLPLNAEIKENFFKAILLDSSLANAMLGLSLQGLNQMTGSDSC